MWFCRITYINPRDTVELSAAAAKLVSFFLKKSAKLVSLVSNDKNLGKIIR